MTSKVYTFLLVAMISFFTCLELLHQQNSLPLLPTTARGTLFRSFNNNSTRPLQFLFPKSSTTWISSSSFHSLHSTWQSLLFHLKRSSWRQQSPKRLNHDTDEKYLTFFTHSGFQNQLIQVENGILLAYYLNRTLILPKAILGDVFGWNQFARLYQHHTLRDPSNTYCQQFKTKRKKRLASCPTDPTKYTVTSFDDLIDLSWAKQYVKIEQRESSDLDWLKYHFGIRQDSSSLNNHQIQHGTYVDGDILFFKDKTRYDWRIYDVPTNHKFLGRYVDSLDAIQLRNRTEKLIHFTSLFGTGKFSIKKLENQEFFNKLKNSITYKHPAVLEMSKVVIDALGGIDNYIGAHLRTADGLFIKATPENIDNMIDKIEKLNNNMTIPTIPPLFSAAANKKAQHLLIKHCVSLAKLQRTQLVFLATDATHLNRSNKKFEKLYKRLPCTFTLNDILPPKNDSLWFPMDQYVTSNTGESMRKFLIPLVDALVASKGNLFIGTKGSTFSGYISRLHHLNHQPI